MTTSTTTAQHVVDQITAPSTYLFPMGIFDAVYDHALGMFGRAPVDGDTNPGRLAARIVEGIVERTAETGAAITGTSTYGPQWSRIVLDESTDDTLIVPFGVDPAVLATDLREQAAHILDDDMIIFLYGDYLPAETDRFGSRHTHP